MTKKNTERFSNRVENYVRYRPHYPEEIIPFLKGNIGLNRGWIIADIGSGTGISSELFLKNGNIVYAIEPNKEMRESAETTFKNESNYISINASAETTTLQGNSIDLIVAGQAFHWFDKNASKKEFQRIAKPEAYLLLMWNERKAESDFQQAYEQLLIEFAIDYEGAAQHNIDESAIQKFFSPHPYFTQILPNAQYFDLESLKGRLLSSSYAPLENHANYIPMLARLKKIFDQFSNSGKIEFAYDCKLYYGNIPPR